MTPKKTLNINGELMDLSEGCVMGILNVTPDSFYAESRVEVSSVLKTAERMLTEGADFLDIGGYSSKPNADDISQEEEIKRTAPVIEMLIKEFPDSIISIDTFRSMVAKQALESGAAFINDITGGQADPEILKLAATNRIPYIGMHMRGNPQTMQRLTDYDDVLKEVCRYFDELKARAAGMGINDLIIDPGFGFAKTSEQNYYLLKNLSFFKHLDCPILVGVSRKSMIYKLLNVDPEEALNGTSALNMLALMNGADILRVHDVKEAKELLKLRKALNDSGF